MDAKQVLALCKRIAPDALALLPPCSPSQERSKHAERMAQQNVDDMQARSIVDYMRRARRIAIANTISLLAQTLFIYDVRPTRGPSELGTSADPPPRAIPMLIPRRSTYISPHRRYSAKGSHPLHSSCSLSPSAA